MARKKNIKAQQTEMTYAAQDAEAAQPQLYRKMEEVVFVPFKNITGDKEKKFSIADSEYSGLLVSPNRGWNQNKWGTEESSDQMTHEFFSSYNLLYSPKGNIGITVQNPNQWQITIGIWKETGELVTARESSTDKSVTLYWPDLTSSELWVSVCVNQTSSNTMTSETNALDEGFEITWSASYPENTDKERLMTYSTVYMTGNSGSDISLDSYAQRDYVDTNDASILSYLNNTFQQKIVVISESEYTSLKNSGSLDQSKIYMVY